jgi:quercetin dioxygenase-like cupin family protein
MRDEPPHIFRDPVVVRHAEAKRFLWGDEESGQVADLIYGRGERISAVIFTLGLGQWFGASKDWKPLYDQHRFYYVAQGSLAIHDPETGDVALATTGEAITWQGSRYHFGYNTGDTEAVVLDWFAPPERPPLVPEAATMPSKRPLSHVVGGRYDLLGHWPTRHSKAIQGTPPDSVLTTVRPVDALNLMHGTDRPLVVSILSSSNYLTGGTFSLPRSSKSEPEKHPGDETLFCLKGKLHVHLPKSGDWFELDPMDCIFLPQGTEHEYWSYSDERAFAAFCIAPHYR